MSASANLYRASWLAWPCRIVCWPLALAGLVAGALLRTLGLALGWVTRSPGAELAGENLARFLQRGVAYLTFASDDYPSLLGAVRRETESPGAYYEAKRRLKKSHVAMASAIVFVLYTYVGIAAQFRWIAADYNDDHRHQERLAPMESRSLEGGARTPRYALGTDGTGRSVLSLTLRGATTALWIGTFAAAFSAFMGMVLGALAGYFGGWVDDLITWLYTTIASIPYLLLLLAFAYAFKSNAGLKAWYAETFLKNDLGLSLGLFQIIMAIGLTSWVGICRIVRGEFIKLRELDYVEAGRALGFSDNRLIFKHILPNVFHLVLVSFSLSFISAIKFEVILSFLGMGLEVGEASWGQMIRAGAQEMLRIPTVWWQITAATVALFFLVLAVNLFADTLRDALDPRLRT